MLKYIILSAVKFAVRILVRCVWIRFIFVLIFDTWGRSSKVIIYCLSLIALGKVVVSSLLEFKLQDKTSIQVFAGWHGLIRPKGLVPHFICKN